MSDNSKVKKPDEARADGATHLNDRRNFLKIGGTGLAALALGTQGNSRQRDCARLFSFASRRRRD